MIVQKIILTNFRNYDHLNLIPSDGVNVFFGANGSGKTNILEAIHYCSLGKSHRLNHDQSAVRFGHDSSLCQVEVFGGGAERKITVQLSSAPAGKKTIFLDEKKISRFSELMGCLQCVIFSPEDLGLIREGPSTRRRFLDMMISQTNRRYFIALQQYRMGLDQRNALLKSMKAGNMKSADWLSDFDQALAAPVELIVRERKKIVMRLNQVAMESYQKITGLDQEELSVLYHSSLKEANEEEIGEAFLNELKSSREEDIRLGLTSAGPHRDDLIFTLNRKNMRMFASQGQVRTAALSIKIAEMKMIYELSGEKPVLLLDDVMSELDQRRRAGLINEIASYQTFITCTDRETISSFHQKIFEVHHRDGKGTVQLIETDPESEKSERASHETLMEDPLFL